MNILFVCTGSTCRSPMAQAVLRHKAKNHNNLKLRIKSAGLSVIYGSTVAHNTRQVLAENQIKLRYVPTQISRSIIDWADLILTMTKDQAEAIISATGKKNVFSFGDYVGMGDVVDPFNRGIDAYRYTFNQLCDYSDKLIEKLNYIKGS